jgi:hypothetical protein
LFFSAPIYRAEIFLPEKKKDLFFRLTEFKAKVAIQNQQQKQKQKNYKLKMSQKKRT